MVASGLTGTVGQTQVLIVDLIERAARRCGLELGEMSNEFTEIARQLLFLRMSHFANRGVTLWTQQLSIFGNVPGQKVYDLTPGIVDIKDALYRTVTLPSGGSPASSAGGVVANAFAYNPTDVSQVCTQSSANGNISYDFGGSVTVPTVGIMPNGAKTYNLVWEYSNDNSTWTSFYAPGSLAYPDLVVSWAETKTPAMARYFRVRETDGGILDVRAVIFGQNPVDLPMSRQNRDDYSNYPNKDAQGTPLQYFVQRLKDAPQIWVWQVPNSFFTAFAIWNFRHVMDPGEMTNTLEVPQRWLLTVIDTLAFDISCEYPKKVPADIRAMLAARMTQLTMEVESEERDDSPETLSPNIGGYTA